MNEIWKKENRAGITAAVVLLLFCIFDVIAGRVLHFDESTYYWAASGFYAVVLLAASLILARLCKTRARVFLKLRSFRLRWLPITLAGAVTATLGAALINLGLSNIGLPESIAPQVSRVFSTGVSDPAAAFMALAIVPAVFEELFIHGASQSSFDSYGSFRAVLLSAFVFSLLHGSVTDLFGTFFAAVIYGYITVVCGSVYPAMLAHLINNLLIGTLMMYGQNFFNIGYNSYFIIAAGALFLISSFIFLCCLERYFKKHPEEPKGRRRVSYIPASIALLLLIWVAKIVLSIYNII